MNRDRRFEDVLDECIGLVAEGRRTIEGCLALYPQWAERLEPLLRLAAELPDAYAAEPAGAYQAEARQRFLAAVHARRPALTPRRRAFPAIRWPFGLPQRVPRSALAAVAVAVLALFVFPSFLLATSGDALPGEWRYPVKRASERLRLAFVFGEDARRGYRIGLAEERLEELQALAERGRPIEASAIREVVNHTEPLVNDLDPQEPAALPQDQVERIEVLTGQQQEILEEVAPLIEEEAADDLEQAMLVSSEGHDRAVLALALATAPGLPAGAGGTATPQAQPSATAAEGTPEAGGSVTPTPTGGASPAATETPGGPTPESTPAPEASPGTEEATATPEPTAVPVTRSVTPLLEDSTGGLNWSLVTIGDFSVRTPNHLENGWVVSSLSTGEQGETLFIGHRLAAVFDVAVVVRIADGEASVYAFVNGSSQRVEFAEVAAMAPPLPEVVFHILESISLGPP